MRIALIYDAVFPYVVGGAEHRNYALAQHWSDTHRVTLYSYGYWNSDRSHCLAGCRYRSVGTPVALYNRHGRRRPLEAIHFAIHLLPALLRSDDEIWDVGSFPYISVLAARLASLMRRRSMVVTWYEFWGEYWERYLGWASFIGRAVERLALAASPYVIAISQRTRDRIVAAGYPEGRIAVVCPGIDYRRIASVPSAARGFDLLYVGRLVPHKQVSLVILGLAKLSTATLGILGDGPLRKELEALARQLGLEDRVTFLGKVPTVDDVYAHMKASRVLVLPSSREGFGITAIEAWACGLPVVVCDEPLSALPDLIDHAHKGRVVQSSPEAIAEGCEGLLTENCPTRAERLMLDAKSFDWSLVQARTLEVYRSVVARSSRIT